MAHLSCCPSPLLWCKGHGNCGGGGDGGGRVHNNGIVSEACLCEDNGKEDKRTPKDEGAKAPPTPASRTLLVCVWVRPARAEPSQIGARTQLLKRRRNQNNLVLQRHHRWADRLARDSTCGVSAARPLLGEGAIAWDRQVRERWAARQRQANGAARNRRIPSARYRCKASTRWSDDCERGHAHHVKFGAYPSERPPFRRQGHTTPKLHGMLDTLGIAHACSLCSPRLPALLQGQPQHAQAASLARPPREGESPMVFPHSLVGLLQRTPSSLQKSYDQAVCAPPLRCKT